VTTIRKLSEVKGTVFDLPASQALPDDDCNVLLVSSRTLFFIQAFARGGVSFLARYASLFLDGAKFVLADTASEIDQINNINNRYEIEVQPVTADLISELQNITLAIQQLAGADCASCGSEVDPDPAPAPPIGPGEDFPTLSAFEIYKCEAVNWLLDTLIDIFTKLDVYPLEFWTAATVGTASALITAIIATTLVSGIFAIVAGAVVALVVALIAGGSFNLTTIKNVLTTNRADLTCILFDGADAATAKSNFINALSALGLSTAETGLVSLILVDNVMNNLFELNPDIEGHTITDVCTGCGADCNLFFGKDALGNRRGTGNLTKDSSTRTLSSVFDAVAGFHFITVNVSDLPDAVTLFASCGPMPASCVGTNNENWNFKPLSLIGFLNAGSVGTRCINGTHTVMWSAGPPTLGVTKQVSWFEFISTTAFTLSCQMTQRA
jgi:hypothetical protein